MRRVFLYYLNFIMWKGHLNLWFRTTDGIHSRTQAMCPVPYSLEFYEALPLLV